MTTTYYYVNAFDNTRTGWSKYGVSPYLDAIDFPTNYILIADAYEEETGDYDFQNSGVENIEVIDSVEIEIYRYDRLNYPAHIYGYVWNGSAWVYIGIFGISMNAWNWISKDVSATLNTWAKIDGARMYLLGTAYDETIRAEFARVDCARIKVVSHAVAVRPKQILGDGLASVIA